MRIVVGICLLLLALSAAYALVVHAYVHLEDAQDRYARRRSIEQAEECRAGKTTYDAKSGHRVKVVR